MTSDTPNGASPPGEGAPPAEVPPAPADEDILIRSILAEVDKKRLRDLAPYVAEFDKVADALRGLEHLPLHRVLEAVEMGLEMAIGPKAVRRLLHGVDSADALVARVRALVAAAQFHVPLRDASTARPSSGIG